MQGLRRFMTEICKLTAAFGFILTPNMPSHAASGGINMVQADTRMMLSWSDLADLALAAPVVIHTRIDNIRRISRNIARDVPEGEMRVLVETSLVTALKAPHPLPAGAEWQWQGPAGLRGQPPFSRGDVVLAFLRPSYGNVPGQYQLITPQAQLPWSPERDAEVRDIIRQALDPQNQGLMVTGVANGFRTEGTVRGQSESQFFLSTAGGRPLTLGVSRQPGSLPQITVATGEIIDRGQQVRPRTLAWHALACGLPAELPATLAEVPGLADDYILAKTAIGPCGRTVEAAR